MAERRPNMPRWNDLTKQELVQLLELLQKFSKQPDPRPLYANLERAILLERLRELLKGE